MRTTQLYVVCLLLLGILNAALSKDTDDATVSSSGTTATTQAVEPTVESKDKRQIDGKDTAVYPNHRSDSNVQDDPEDGQESIYGNGKSNRFIIRPLLQHHSHKEDADEEQQQHQQQHRSSLLRNYPVTIRPHSTQQLEQSQEIQHFAYLQDITRHQTTKNAVELQDKTHSSSSTVGGKKSPRLLSSSPSQLQTQSQPQSQSQTSSNAEEAEQRYAVAVQAAPPPQRHYQPGPPYQSGQQPYQIIPEEHFLRLIEQELQARAYHEDQQLRHQQHLSSGGKSSSERSAAAPPPPPPGLGSYRQRIAENLAVPPPSAPEQQYVQYVPRHRGGPKYLPLPSTPLPEPQVSEPQEPDSDVLDSPHRGHAQQPEIPPQLAYYQPQISYKTLPNHPLAKSSLEKEIEKLLAANKANVQIFDTNSNEHSLAAAPTLSPYSSRRPSHSPSALIQPKSFIASTTPNSLLDANNQPFIPSLFQFSNYQTPTPVYPTEVTPPPQHLHQRNHHHQQQQQQQQQISSSKNVGPVVYPPTQTPTAQPSQYYYHQQQQQQDASPTNPPKPKAYRSKPHYGTKITTGPSAAASLKPREKALASAKYQTQTLLYEYNEQPQQTGPVQFHPSPLDPTKSQPTQQPSIGGGTGGAHHQPPHASAFRQYALPSPTPSQSNIYVSQATGSVSPTRPHSALKAKTVDDVKKLRLPQPGNGGKPLTQEEFQALIDAGYPVTAVPVPVPVPYEQYVKDHPEYRNQPLDYSHLMRLAQQQYAAIPHHQQQQHHPQLQHHQQQQQTQHHHHRTLAAASEPSVKIISSPTETQTASALGGGSITYLRPIGGNEQQKRHPRNENDTKVEGSTKNEETKKTE